jgi:hypothetical protein
MSKNPLSEETSLAPKLNIVIIYETIDFATKASAMLQKAWRGLEETIRWSFQPWRVDILELPSAADEALAEARGAHMILFAMRQVLSLPQWLFHWLERWATGRSVPDAALAIWDASNTAPGPARASSELIAFANRHGLSLILDDIAPSAGRSLGRASHHHSHWGINE